MSSEAITNGKNGLTLMQGGINEPPFRVRQVDLQELLPGNDTQNPLPEPLTLDQLSITCPEQHESLTLQGINLLQVRMELTNPFTTSFGTIRNKDVVLVVLKTKDGVEGIGECPVNPNPDYNEESTQTVLTVLDKHLIPSLRDMGEISSVDDLTKAYGRIKGNFAAKTGVEAAYWDLLSKIEDVPLHQFWGGRNKHALTGVSIGGKTVDEVLQRVDRAVEKGFPRIKLKIWPGFDVELVDAVRSRYPDLPLQVDANSAYSLNDVDTFRELDRFGLILIEQPFSPHDLLDHARLQTQIGTSICLDESLKTLINVRQAIELWRHIGKLNRLVVNIKPPRMGGYWEAVKAADLCQAAGVRAWCGGMLDSAWTKRMNVQLSSHPAFILPGDHAQQEPYYTEDIANPPVQGEHGIAGK